MVTNGTEVFIQKNIWNSVKMEAIISTTGIIALWTFDHYNKTTNRSRHCLPDRLGNSFASSDQLLVPYSVTSCVSFSSSWKHIFPSWHNAQCSNLYIFYPSKTLSNWLSFTVNYAILKSVSFCQFLHRNRTQFCWTFKWHMDAKELAFCEKGCHTNVPKTSVKVRLETSDTAAAVCVQRTRPPPELWTSLLARNNRTDNETWRKHYTAGYDVPVWKLNF